MVLAEQTHFQRQVSSDSIVFSYRWTDANDEQQSLSFEVARQSFLQPFANFRALSPARINREVQRPLRNYAREQGWHDLELRLVHKGEKLEMSFRQGNASENEQRLTELQAQVEQFKQEIIERNYYQYFQDQMRRDGYKVNHRLVAKESQALLSSMADAIRQQQPEASARQHVEFIAGFLQSIPYQELDDRLQSHGAGFSPPNRLLLENRGDCDSKATLMAALLAQLQPELTTAMVFLPGHAVLAFAEEINQSDLWVRVNDERMVVVDPTGPSKLPVGTVSQRYEPDVRSGAVVVELMHNP